jgi:hypothetical protein
LSTLGKGSGRLQKVLCALLGCSLDHQIKSVSLDVEDLYLLRVVMDLLTQQRDDIQQGWSS